MLPLLRQRKDIVEIRKKTVARCKKYDVALYKRGNKYILHRCIDVRPNGYVFAGDHNTFKEYDVTDSMILGIMTRVIRDGKNIYPTDLSYQIYSFLWTNFFPIKVFLFKTRSFFSHLKKMLKFQ